MAVTHLPQDEALCAIASVLEAHVRKIQRCEERDAPLIVQLDGPGHSEMLARLKARLRPEPGSEPLGTDAPRTERDEVIQQLTTTPGLLDGEKPWTVVEFDAWQHQRLAPPWWWLVDTIDRQIREDHKPGRRQGGRQDAPTWKERVRWWGRRFRNVLWVARQFGRELVIVLPLLMAAVLLWLLASAGMDHVLQSVAVIATAVSALLGVTIASMKTWRRGMLLSAGDRTQAVLRSSDPMKVLRERYAFLLDELDAPVVVLVDNLDRCQADCVVDMLEGLQTLLRHPQVRRRDVADNKDMPFVAFVVAADRDWLCNSFTQRYEKFSNSARQPGQQFGQAFLEKIFDLELRLPTIPAAFSPYDEQHRRRMDEIENEAVKACTAVAERAGDAKLLERSSELAIRKIVSDAEATAARCMGDKAAPRPLHTLRIAAVASLRDMEHDSALSTCPDSMQHLCADTAASLHTLVERLDIGSRVVSKIDTAYCVHRTTQLLGGHEILAEDDPMTRLALWAILSTTWPLLATHLCANPTNVACLRDGIAPDVTDAWLRAAFAQRAARQLVSPSAGVSLSGDDIRRFSTPVDLDAQLVARVRPGHDAPSGDDVVAQLPAAAVAG